MPTVRQRHPEDRVAGFQCREKNDLIGLRAGMRLHVGCLGVEHFLGPFDRELLDHVDKFATAVITLAGIAFGVLVREPRPLRLEHRQARVVFGGDELDVRLLPLVLADDGGPELGIGLGEVQRMAGHGSGPGLGNGTTIVILASASPRPVRKALIIRGPSRRGSPVCTGRPSTRRRQLMPKQNDEEVP